MAEYIEREAAKRAVKHIPWCNYSAVGACLDQLPAADVEVVKHGRWILREDGYHCSNCDIQAIYTGVKLNYCPNCGAHMDLEGTNGLDQH